MENQELKIENCAEGSRKYIYRDNFNDGKIVFECVAAGITEADKMYEEKTGKNPEKQPYIGCSIEEIDVE